jgi:hypothetical protein
MIYIYVSEIQEEAQMDNKQHWKRGKETYTCIPTLIHILQKSQGNKNHQRERDPKRNINSILTMRHTHRYNTVLGGYILTRGVNLF